MARRLEGRLGGFALSNVDVLSFLFLLSVSAIKYVDVLLIIIFWGFKWRCIRLEMSCY